MFILKAMLEAFFGRKEERYRCHRCGKKKTELEMRLPHICIDCDKKDLEKFKSEYKPKTYECKICHTIKPISELARTETVNGKVVGVCIECIRKEEVEGDDPKKNLL